MADPSPDAVMIAVKPLVWVEGPSSHDTHIARTPWNTYTVWEIEPHACWTLDDTPGRLLKGTLDDAKAAAQADYEARIRSALDTDSIARAIDAARREENELVLQTVRRVKNDCRLVSARDTISVVERAIRSRLSPPAIASEKETG